MPSRYADPENIFLKARLRAGNQEPRLLSRAYTAEKLHCSTDSLELYEQGRVCPPEEVVIRMAEVYQDVFLIFEAFERTPYGKFFKQFLGLSVTRKAISEATLGFINERNDLNDGLMNSLIAAAADCRFDERENGVIHRVAEESKQFINQAAGLICLTQMAVNGKTAVSAAVNR